MKPILFDRIIRLRKFLVFSYIGAGVFGLGLMILFILNLINVDIIAANTIQLVLTFIVNLELNRRITWRDRNFDSWTVVRFFTSRLVIASLSWIAFIPLQRSVNYITANVILVAAATVFNFTIGDKYVFRPRKMEVI